MPHRDPHHHENPHHARHRDQIFQQLSAEIMRESRDPAALRLAAGRALAHPDVRSDGALHGQLQAFISSRESELRARLDMQRDERLHGAGAAGPAPLQLTAIADSGLRPAADGVTARQWRLRYEKLDHDLADRLAHFDLVHARELLERIDAMQRDHPDEVRESEVQRRRMDYQKAVARRRELDAEVDRLAEEAAAASAAGATEATAAAVKRLSALHASRPEILPAARFDEIRHAIAEAATQSQLRDAVAALMARERAIAQEVRSLADSVHRFHELSRTLPHGDPRYAAAEAEYFRTIREVRHHDKAWLADMMEELDELLVKVHDPSGTSDQQVTRFVESVRCAISRTVAEIRQIAAEAKSEN